MSRDCLSLKYCTPSYSDAVSHGEMYFLDMKALKASSGSAISWTDVGATPYGSTYQPVMALAQNHIHFLDVPNVPAGSADIFVIHCESCSPVSCHIIIECNTDSYFQPTPQAYPLPSGSMPATHGQTTSFFQPSDVCRISGFCLLSWMLTIFVSLGSARICLHSRRWFRHVCCQRWGTSSILIFLILVLIAL